MKRRGSAYIYVLLMIVAITIVGMAASDASMSFILTQKRVERGIKADVILQGAIDYFEADRLANRVSLPYSKTVTIDNVSCEVTATEHAKPGIMQVVASCVYRDYSYSKKAYLVKDRFSPFQYAIATEKKLDSGRVISTGVLGDKGSIYGDDVDVTNVLNTISGDVDAFDDTVANGVILGSKNSDQGAILFPTLTSSDYTAAATTTLTGNQTINGYTFAAVAAGASYPLVVINGDLTIRGTITGIGTFYVTGNVIINGAMSYANSSSRVAIITRGSATIGGFNTVGYLYAEGNIEANGLIGASVTRGSLAARGSLVFNRSVTVIHDPAVTNDLNEGVRMRLPAYWPAP